MKRLPLTVLAHEGPQVRAYLGRMRQAGWRPERILLMVQRRNPATGKRVGAWLPRRLRLGYAERAQEMAQNHWPRRLKARYPRLVAAMSRELVRICDGAAELIDEMRGRFRYEDYAPRVERVLVENLRDPVLTSALSSTAPGAVLYSGGGILRQNLLGIPGIRFLHVHPGHLPEVRGADGLLWSMLVRGRPGASCFYMESGIDTGEIVAAEDFPALRFDLGDHPRIDDVHLYRAIFSFYDPVLRAELLVSRVLSRQRDLSRLEAKPQEAGGRGIQYHFMHPRLRQRALETLFQFDGSRARTGAASIASPAGR